MATPPEINILISGSSGFTTAVTTVTTSPNVTVELTGSSVVSINEGPLRSALRSNSSSHADIADNALTAVTASFSLTNAGFIANATTASYAIYTDSILGEHVTGSVPSASYVDWGTIDHIPSGIVSSSTQFSTGSFTGSFYGEFSGSILTTASNAMQSVSSSYSINANIASVSITSSFAEVATTASFVSRSYVADSALLSNISTAAISSSYSLQSTTASFADNYIPPVSVSFALTANSASFVSHSYTSDFSLLTTSASYSVTASYVSGAASTWDSITNKPVGIVSTSAQINTGSFTGSYTGAFIGIGTNITGIVSSSYAEMASTASFVSRSYVADTAISADFRNLNNIPVGIISSSVQATNWSVLSSSYAITSSNAISVDFTGILNKPTLISASSQVSYDGLNNIPVGIVSSSAQASTWTVLSASHAGSDWNEINNKPIGIISASSQISYNGLSNIPVGILSSSTQFNALANTSASYANTTTNAPNYLPLTGGNLTNNLIVSGNIIISASKGFVGDGSQITGVISSSYSNVASRSYAADSAITADYRNLNNIPIGIVSSSTQASGWTVLSSSYASISSRSYASDNALNANSASYASAVTWNNINTKPDGIVSASSQIDFIGISNKPTLVSASSQINTGSFTGSYTGAFIGIGTGITGIISSSYATTASYAVTASYAIKALSSSYASTAGGVGSGISGGGTAGRIAQFTDTQTISDSKIYDDGTNLEISSSIILSGSLNAALYNVTASAFRGDGTAITGIISSSYSVTSSFVSRSYVADSALTANSSSYASAVTWNNINAKPIGLVSASSQISYTGLINIPVGIISSSTQVDFNTINNKPALVSASSQVDFAGIINKPTLVSASSQINTGSFTGSYTGAFVGIGSGISGVISSSFAQNTLNANSATTASFVSKSYVANSAITADYRNLSNVPNGLISSSGQVSYTGLSNIPIGIVSSSGQVDFSAISNKPTIVSASSQISYPALSNIPVGIVSSSAQINTGSFTGSFTGAFVGIGSGITGIISSSYAMSSSFAVTASYAIKALSSSYASTAGGVGSGVSGTGTAGRIPVFTDTNTVSNSNLNQSASIVEISASVKLSGSLNATNYSITASSFTGTGAGITGVISSSFAQNTLNANSAISTSFVSRSYVADNALNANSASYASAVTWNNINAKPIGIISSSGQVSYTGLSNIPVGIVSSSAQINTGSFTGSFTGAFSGIGTNITNVPYNSLSGIPSGLVSSSNQVSYTGLINIPVGIVSSSAQVDFNGIINKPTLVSASSQINTGSFTGSYTGAFAGIGNNVTGIVSSSYALTASFALNGGGGPSISASYSDTASFVPGGSVVTGSVNYQLISGSVIIPASQPTPYINIALNSTFGSYAFISAIPSSSLEIFEGFRIKVDLTNYNQIRIGAYVSGNAAPGTTMTIKYSTDQSTWTWLTNTIGTPSASISSVGTIYSNWEPLNNSSKSDIFIQSLLQGGDGTTSASIGTITIQVR